LVIGRRTRLLYRVVWLLVSIVVLWAIIMLPVILVDHFLKSWIPALSWIPIVPLAIAIVSSGAIVWASSYLFLLYRRVVEDDASPA
jgi:hypothetical protein